MAPKCSGLGADTEGSGGSAWLKVTGDNRKRPANLGITPHTSSNAKRAQDLAAESVSWSPVPCQNADRLNGHKCHSLGLWTGGSADLANAESAQNSLRGIAFTGNRQHPRFYYALGVHPRHLDDGSVGFVGLRAGEGCG